jgi:hypothetical protein
MKLSQKSFLAQSPCWFLVLAGVQVTSCTPADVLQYACWDVTHNKEKNRSGGKSSKAGKLGSALTLGQNPNFEMASCKNYQVRSAIYLSYGAQDKHLSIYAMNKF